MVIAPGQAEPFDSGADRQDDEQRQEAWPKENGNHQALRVHTVMWAARPALGQLEYKPAAGEVVKGEREKSRRFDHDAVSPTSLPAFARRPRRFSTEESE
jgi:hypothetical protein